jgi:hypothetical protein
MAKINGVFGIYGSPRAVECAARGFKDAGFSGSEISVILPGKREAKQKLTETETKPPQSTTGSADSGVGAALGWLVGVGALTLPGIGPVIAIGPLAAALGGVAIAEPGGGFARSLIALEIPEADARRYEHRLLTGGILIAIHCETAEQFQRAREIMEITRAEDIASYGKVSSESSSTAA